MALRQCEYTVKVELVSLLQLKIWFLRWQN